MCPWSESSWSDWHQPDCVGDGLTSGEKPLPKYLRDEVYAIGLAKRASAIHDGARRVFITGAVHTLGDGFDEWRVR